MFEVKIEPSTIFRKRVNELTIAISKRKNGITKSMENMLLDTLSLNKKLLEISIIIESNPKRYGSFFISEMIH